MDENQASNQGAPSPFPPPLPSSGDDGPVDDSLQTTLISASDQVDQGLQQQSAQQTSVSSDPQVIGERQLGSSVVLTQAAVYFSSGQFDQEVREFQAAGNLRTGYKILDRKQPLYPGLYCLGAISSLGKTTFCHQMADQIATSGQWVLYFSLEQTHLELYSKSLARGFYQTNRYDTRQNNRPSSYPTPSSMDIRRGLTAVNHAAELDVQINIYKNLVGNRLCIVDGSFELTVEDIRKYVEEAIKQLKVRPVVIVDYLQIIAPSLINGRIPDTKTSIDHIVHSLKILQRDYNLAIIAVSALNRQNYLTPIDFESFKESGGIEYTADVIWGLQLSVLNDKAFYHHYDNTSGKQKSETSLKEKREMIQKAKAASPRDIDLVCLKNRYGISSYTVPFRYYPAFDFYCPPYDLNDPDTWG